MAAGNQQGWAWTRAEMMDRFDMATEGDSQGLGWWIQYGGEAEGQRLSVGLCILKANLDHHGQW